MTDSNPPPVHMPDHEPIRRRNGQPIPPPRVVLRGMFGTPPSLASLPKTRFGDQLKPHGMRGMK